MKKLVQFLVVLILVFSILACNNETTTQDITTQASETTTVDEISSNLVTTQELPKASDLVNDEFAVGKYFSDFGISRIPADEAYQLLLLRKEPLKVGETYVEDFEGDFLNSKIYPYRTDAGAEFSFVTAGIDGLSLVLNTIGNYSGLYLNGMKFSANSSYQISFDYKILSGSNEFFLQFRSLNGGVESDVYVNFSSDNNNVNHYSFQADLGDYNDYELMMFPRFDSGIVAIDNISITRIDSKPLIDNYHIQGELQVGSELSVIYDFYDAEEHLEGDTLFRWFSALDEQGKNKEILATDSTSITVSTNMLGKYIICEVTPVSRGVGAVNNIGRAIYVVSSKLPGNIVTQVEVNLEANEFFVEDFEEDITVIHNLFFEEIDQGKSYIQTNGNNKELKLSGMNPFAGLFFTGINFEKSKVYNISFDYRIIEMPSNIYVQMRTDSGGMEHDKYFNLNLQDKELNTQYHFDGEFGLDNYGDYKLMIFFGNTPGTIAIDNIRIEDIDEINYQVNSVELNIGEYIFEDFDLNTRYLGFDFAQVPNSMVTDDSNLAISGSSLYFESAGSFLCLFINQGLIYTPNATYQVSFDYKIISITDTIYVQFNGGAYGNVFTEFGGDNDLNSVYHFTYDFELLDTSNYIIQVFPGQSLGNTIVIIDNIKIERIK